MPAVPDLWRRPIHGTRATRLAKNGGSPCRVDLLHQSTENEPPLHIGTINSAVITWTLCSHNQCPPVEIRRSISVARSINW